jgi:hypothetical protein
MRQGLLTKRQAPEQGRNRDETGDGTGNRSTSRMRMDALFRALRVGQPVVGLAFLELHCIVFLCERWIASEAAMAGTRTPESIPCVAGGSIPDVACHVGLLTPQSGSRLQNFGTSGERAGRGRSVRRPNLSGRETCRMRSGEGAMQKARRGFPPGLYTEASAYAFLHESCFTCQRKFSHDVGII